MNHGFTCTAHRGCRRDTMTDLQSLKPKDHAEEVAIFRSEIVGALTRRDLDHGELAATLKDLAPTMPWLVEQAFAKLLGPIAGQRDADIGRRLLAFPEYAAERVGGSVVSFAHEQSGLLATGDEGSAFMMHVSALAARVDALALRIDDLDARVPATVVPAKFGRKKPGRPQTV